MATQTATIRVPQRTRELLAQQAKQRGVSLSRLLVEMAENGARASAMASERDATRADSRDPAATAEDMEWAESSGDGIE